MDLRKMLRSSQKKRLKAVDPPEQRPESAVLSPAEPQPEPQQRRGDDHHHQHQQQAVELGTLRYCNLTPDGRHGDYDAALNAAAAAANNGSKHKPIFANFVEWSG